MARRRNQKTVIVIVAILAIVALVVILGNRKALDFHDKYAGADLSREVTGAERSGTYAKYLESHAGAATPSSDAEVDIFDISDHSGDVEIRSDYYGEAQAVYTETGSEVTWNVDVP
ncbi:MAG: ABC transporter substrate-binding protein, partial [Lachnospiraceae bacterium]|nr:ABC transporter substrate-binding protein [Lachnospiraceae bacterium]